MLLVEEEIRRRTLVQPESEIFLKNSTCDLTVGKIFSMGNPRKNPSGKSDAGEYLYLKPNHMAYVVSCQRVCLPKDVTGLATLVTTLTQKGILCLNVGIIDPGYQGNLGAVLVNFSQVEKEIKVGDRLFRVVFFQHKEISDLQPYNIDSYSYKKKVEKSAQTDFSESFLNIHRIKREAEERAIEIVSDIFRVKWLPWIVAFFAIVFGVYANFFKE